VSGPPLISFFSGLSPDGPVGADRIIGDDALVTDSRSSTREVRRPPQWMGGVP
jgi:hypothetical protein